MTRLSSSLISFAAVGALAISPVSAKATTLSQTARMNSNTVASTSTVKTRQASDDTALTDRISKRVKADASLKRFDIDVSVTGGVATLTGKVRTDAEKARAARDARVAGVTRVDNQLTIDKDAGRDVAETVKSGTNTAANKTRSAVDTATDKTEHGVAVGADKTKEGLSKTGEVITDSWITTKVHAKFVGEDLLKGSDINVDANNHVVTLKGTVKSDAARARAVAIAKGTDGVTRVVDQLTIAR